MTTALFRESHPRARAHVAVVDDEPHLRETLDYALRRDGHRVTCHADGREAWEALESAPPDVAILDVLMPRMDGLELCRRLRARSESLPILFVSSKDDEFDRVLGLEIGADDYLCKPFSIRELLARVRVLLRHLALLRSPCESEARRLRVGDLELDLDRYGVCWGGDDVALTVTEFLILRALAERPGFVKSRDQLMREGHPDDAYVSDRTIDSHIKRIRAKFRARGGELHGLETVHGLGYRLRAVERPG